MKKSYSTPTVNHYNVGSYNMICASVQSGGEGNGVPADARETHIFSHDEAHSSTPTEADWD